MNRDDVIRMAREAGMAYRAKIEEFSTPMRDGVDVDDLAKFAALVAAAEKETCAALCEKDGLLWVKRYAAAIRANGQA